MVKWPRRRLRDGTEALFTREGMPPVKGMIPCALQHVLASFAGIITPAVIMASVYGFNSQQSTDIIQVAPHSFGDRRPSGLRPFRRIGGPPIVMGVSFAFLPALQAMGASGFSFGALLGGEMRRRRRRGPLWSGLQQRSSGCSARRDRYGHLLHWRLSPIPRPSRYMAGGMGTLLGGTRRPGASLLSPSPWSLRSPTLARARSGWAPCSLARSLA